ncbi:hypothetical protein PAXRUDRAFT_329817 [Paxillus rubicundulus Ve08.2h10]|uniref:Uncharacterized protein n=1 Tax=Paxillus rubicundulus Ve08.2h10 TaxID=930991 RepID=A0A0D0ECX9_9AGAM|nr:hypothetical protein PAXRUDRAFT_329817 [Paxillus rubicundulus Ve08.2h10]
MAPVSTQPIPSLMNVYTVGPFGDAKLPQQCQVHYDSEQPCGCADSSSHRACHKARLRKMLLPVALSLLAIGGMLVVSCATDINLLDLIGLGGDSGSLLGKRETSSSFTNNKLYLIIIFVHLKIHCAAHATCAHAVVALLAWNALDVGCVRLDSTRLSDSSGFLLSAE